MRAFGPENVFVLASTVLAAATLIFTLLTWLRASSQKRYDERLQRVELEAIRRSLEDQIYKLTDRLTASDKRWQDVNHLLINAQGISGPTKIGSAPRLDFLRRAGLGDDDYELDRRLVFVLIPFHRDFQMVYETIREACQRVGLLCLRGDEEYLRGDILAHILKMIVKARLILAVVDGRNPNVFYELGIAHTLDKTVVILAKSPGDVPFDVRSNRIIFYSDLSTLSAKLGPELTKAIVAEQ